MDALRNGDFLILMWYLYVSIRDIWESQGSKGAWDLVIFIPDMYIYIDILIYYREFLEIL